MSVEWVLSFFMLYVGAARVLHSLLTRLYCELDSTSYLVTCSYSLQFNWKLKSLIPSVLLVVLNIPAVTSSIIVRMLAFHDRPLLSSSNSYLVTGVEYAVPPSVRWR